MSSLLPREINVDTKKKIKVLRLSPVLDFGGVESRFTLQCREWNDDSIHVEYACFWKDGAAANAIRDAGGTVHVLDEDPAVRNPRATQKLLAFLRKHDFDVVHSSIGEANYHNALCSKLGPWKAIIEETGLPNRRLRNRAIHAVLYRMVDKVVAVSQKSADYVLDREWAPASLVHVINNPARREFFTAHHRPYDPSSITFRAVGRLETVKNLLVLVDAFSDARKLNEGIRLEIYGAGTERDAIAERIAHRNASSFISLHGFSENIAELHHTTDWLLLPSLSEGFSVAACEALAMGVPVIASAVGGNPEILRPIDHSLIVPSTDVKPWTQAILRAACLPKAEYDELTAKIASSSRRFHPDNYVAKLRSLYVDTVGRS